MLAWLESLTLLEQILLYVAIPATLLLLIQTVLLFLGMGGEHDGTADSPEGAALLDMDAAHDFVDLNGDGIPDMPHDLELHGGHCDACGEHNAGEHNHEGSGNGLHVLTLRGIVAFFTLFGWSGLMFCQLNFHWFLALFLAVQVGIIGMVGVAFILREALRFQEDGTLDIRNAVGLPGSVYLTVPGERSGVGKVNVVVQEQLREFEAVTEEKEPIPTGADVLVTGITNGDTLIVKAL